MTNLEPSAGDDARIKRVVVVVAAVAATVFGAVAVWHACYTTLERSDLPVFLAAGRAVLERTDVYAAHSARGWHYVYPPPFAILMIPFTQVPKPLAALAWYLVSLALFAHALRRCVSVAMQLNPRWSDPFVLYALPVVVLSWPLASVLERGQSSVLTLWLCTIAMSRHRTSVPTAAAGLAGAIVLRGFPATLLAYFAWRRQWRFIGVTVLIALILGLVLPALVIGWERNLAYWERWTTGVVSPGMTLSGAPHRIAMDEDPYNPNFVNNQALAAVLQRLTASHTAPLASIAIGSLMALATIISARKARRRTEPLVVAHVFVWMLLIMPVSRAYHFMLLLWPISVVLVLTAEPSVRRVQWTARGSLVVLGGLSLVGGVWQTARFYGPLCWGSVAIWLALLTAISNGDHEDARSASTSTNRSSIAPTP